VSGVNGHLTGGAPGWAGRGEWSERRDRYHFWHVSPEVRSR
jgi:hypothetical protein